MVQLKIWAVQLTGNSLLSELLRRNKKISQKHKQPSFQASAVTEMQYSSFVQVQGFGCVSGLVIHLFVFNIFLYF